MQLGGHSFSEDFNVTRGKGTAILSGTFTVPDLEGTRLSVSMDPFLEVDPPFSIDTKRCVTRGQWAWANPKTVPMGLPHSRPSVALPGCAYVGRDQSHPIKRKTTDSCS